MKLRLRKAKGNRPEPPDWGDDDYDVTSGGRVVGRIYRRAGVGDDQQPWLWSILLVTRTGETTSGITATLEQAKQAFAEAWRRTVGSQA